MNEPHLPQYTNRACKNTDAHPQSPATLRTARTTRNAPASSTTPRQRLPLSVFSISRRRGSFVRERTSNRSSSAIPAGRRAAGFVAAVDCMRTDVGPYREWILGIWVAPRGTKIPELKWINTASAPPYPRGPDDKAFMFFSPKMGLTEALPTEVGVEHYGIPKEQGTVTLQHSASEPLLSARIDEQVV